MAFLSFFVITISNNIIFFSQAIVYGISVLLFASLILPPRSHLQHHAYGHFAERQEINRLCMVCLRVMQGREYHCPTCRICIPQYDHHCFWINNCIGKGNIVRFNSFLIFTQISLIWLGYLSISTLVLLFENER